MVTATAGMVLHQLRFRRVVVVDPRGADQFGNWNVLARRIYGQASGGSLIKLPRQWFRPDLISRRGSCCLKLSVSLSLCPSTQVSSPSLSSPRLALSLLLRGSNRLATDMVYVDFLASVESRRDSTFLYPNWRRRTSSELPLIRCTERRRRSSWPNAPAFKLQARTRVVPLCFPLGGVFF